MRIFLATLVVLAWGLLGVQPAARGQWNTNSSSGMFGNRSFGNTLSSGASNFGGGGAFGNRGGFGSGQGLSGSTGGAGGMAAPLRVERQAGDFVGADSRDLPNLFSAMSGAGNLNRGFQSGMLSGGQNRTTGANQPNNSRTGRAGSGRTAGEIRTTMRVGFDYTRPAPDAIASKLTALLEKSTRIQTRSALDISVQDGTAILRGAVATEHDRVLIEQLARLEAGVWRVQNELVVGEPAVPPAGPPALPPIPAPPEMTLPPSSMP